jgi:hypothetical protein
MVAALAICLSGCNPEERFWWSPDGTQAAVVVDEELYLVAADGALKEPLGIDLGPDANLPKRVSWLPDGHGFVLHRSLALPTWQETRALLPADEVSQIERLAAAQDDGEA